MGFFISKNMPPPKIARFVLFNRFDLKTCRFLDSVLSSGGLMQALAIKTCDRACHWIRDMENEVFVLGTSPFSW